jgi:hypothetical protein
MTTSYVHLITKEIHMNTMSKLIFSPDLEPYTIIREHVDEIGPDTDVIVSFNASEIAAFEVFMAEREACYEIEAVYDWRIVRGDHSDEEHAPIMPGAQVAMLSPIVAEVPRDAEVIFVNEAGVLLKEPCFDSYEVRMSSSTRATDRQRRELFAKAEALGLWYVAGGAVYEGGDFNELIAEWHHFEGFTE